MNMRFPGVLLALLIPLGTGPVVRAQTWTLDSNVAPALANDVSLLLSASWVPTPSGQFLVYGDFTHVSGAAAPGLARISVDGKLDPTFAADLAGNERVTALVPLTDGRAMALISTTNLGVAVPMPPGVATPVASASDGMAVGMPAVVVGGGGIVVAPTTVTTRLIRIGTTGRKDASYTPIDIKGYGQLTALSDGAVMMWGNFVAATSPARNSLLRLKPDGTVDPTFNNGLGSPNNTTAGINIAALAAAPNGAFVYSYTSWGNVPAGGGVGYHLDRVQPSGAVDSQFGPRVSTVYSLLAAQPDGGVLAAGPAISIGIAVPASTAPTADGSGSNGSTAGTLPTPGTVQPVTPPSTVIPPLTVPPTVIPAIPAPVLVTRYTATGALDATYNPPIAATKSITRMAALPSGRVAVEANVGPSTYGAPAVFVLTSTGQIERDFRQLPGASEGQRLLATLSDGRVLVAQGTLVLNSTYYYPVPYDAAMPATTTAIMPIFFGPVLANPTLGISPPDASAGATTPLVTLPTTIAHRYAGFVSRLESDSAGRVLATGQFTQVDNQPRPGLARFLTDGGLDLSYNPAAGSLVFAPSDGRVIVSRSSIGPVNASDGYHRYLTDFVRLQTDGAVDGTFAFPSSLSASATHWLAAASDGRLLISAFDPDESREQNLKLIWLGSDGRRLTTLSTVFTGFTRNIIMPLAATTTVADAATAVASATTSITVTTVSGAVGISVPTDSVATAVAQTAVASASGATAATTTGPASVVIAQPALPFGRPNVIDAVQILSNGQLLVAGAFSQVNGVARPGLVRLQADGSLDTAYAPSLSALTYRYGALLLPDGRAIVFGSTVILGRWQSATVRLRADGTVDSTFVPPPNTFGSDARLLADGSLFSSGKRYTADGWPDLNFAPQLGLSGNSIGVGTTAVRVAASGPLWLGGNFDQVNGQVRSGVARFTPGETIGITVQPKNQSVVAGREAIFQVGIGTLQPATYRWTHDGAMITGATNAYLRTPVVGAADGGAYRAIVTIGAQTFTSDAATLTVLPNRSRLVNFSARSFVSASSAPQIAGIVCIGEPRQVLLRAVGLGMPVALGNGSSALSMPVLTLYDGANAIGSDRGGATSSAASSLAVKVGAFPINTNFNAPVVNAVYGSALTPALRKGAFTAITSSGNGTSGVSLFECYDTGDESSTPLIRNFAIRGQTSAGANVLIGGFVISGNGPMRVLVRGLGPALAGFGVADAITNPHLEVYAAGAGAAVAANDGWNGDAVIAAASRSTGAFPLGADARDAAMVLILEPGAYTAQLTSSTGAAGTAMIEIYSAEEN